MPVLKIKRNGQWEAIGAVTNANTLDGKPASYFATVLDIDELQRKVGDTDVSEQIASAIEDSGHATVAYIDDMNSIDYEAYLAFDTTEIV